MTAHAPNSRPELVLTPVARRGKPPRHLADLTPDERRDAVLELGQPAYRARQLATHYFGRLVEDPARMPDLPRAERGRIAESLLPPLLTPVRALTCDDGLTVKFLWRLFDGALVESVLMRYPGRQAGQPAQPGRQAGQSAQPGRRAGVTAQPVRQADQPAQPGRQAGVTAQPAPGTQAGRVTMCVSSQAGCGMACPFCATGQNGLTRNLSTAEIVAQVVAGARMLAAGEVAGGPGRVSNVVFMGMGEPMANYRAVIGGVRRMTDPVPDGLGISQRGITVSTVGLVPRIEQLTREGLHVTLALSLHAPDDELRDELVPINTRWKVAEVLAAARAYAEKTGRRISIEYALIRDINDQAWRADLLGDLLATGFGPLVHVNLIPLNPTPGSRWTASRPRDEAEFVRRLERHGVATTVRDTRGREIDGACGQLAASTP